jgi:hypothetical protein
MGMNLTEKDLLPTEVLLAPKLANLWVKAADHGVCRFPIGNFLGDNEAIAGKAFLTNYRILFKSHNFNRLIGTCSLFLPNIRRIRKGVIGITVETIAQEYSFVMWFNGYFVDKALERVQGFGREDRERLRQLVCDHPDRIGERFQEGKLQEMLTGFLAGLTQALELVEKLSGPERATFSELVGFLSGAGQN